ncbi:MAG: CapA family protein [Candidatus Sphingomonas phytovorans]|nr:CapA family protein [Sphingomonas sp.]WEK00231.1 MAG: CapA family protein [Sphingomonas sp.]
MPGFDQISIARGCRLAIAGLGGLLVAAAPALARSVPAEGSATIRVALGGDLIGPLHPMNRLTDRAFAEVAELFRTADIGFANQENSVFDLKGFMGYPAAENGGGQPLRYASHARDMKDMGLSLVSVANNHATDFGPEGLTATLRNLSAAGIVAGGAGLSDVAARGPVYVDSPKGAVALVATASTFPPLAVAGSAIERHGISSQTRPGISSLHVRKVRLLPRRQFEAVRQAVGPLALPEGDGFRIDDQLFRPGPAAAMHWEMKPDDRDALLAAVGEARQRADLVMFSIHAHETAGDAEAPTVPFNPMVLQRANEAASPNDPRPANFQVELFHSVVDRGADIVARHGPHIIAGIEIFKGKPIFYGLGSLFLDFGGDRILDAPSGEKIYVPDSWFDGFVPICTFVAGRLERIDLYPITLESHAGERSGSPSLAHGDHAHAILQTLKKLSAPFGTEIEIVGDIGVITVRA